MTSPATISAPIDAGPGIWQIDPAHTHIQFAVKHLSATTRISRKEFGLNWNDGLESGGVVVGDQVNVSIEIELVRQESAAAA